MEERMRIPRNELPEHLMPVRDLDDVYELALRACDPLDFANRQKNLVWAIGKFLTEPLHQYELEKEMEDEDKEREKENCDPT